MLVSFGGAGGSCGATHCPAQPPSAPVMCGWWQASEPWLQESHDFASLCSGGLSCAPVFPGIRPEAVTWVGAVGMRGLSQGGTKENAEMRARAPPTQLLQRKPATRALAAGVPWCSPHGSVLPCDLTGSVGGSRLRLPEQKRLCVPSGQTRVPALRLWAARSAAHQPFPSLIRGP